MKAPRCMADPSSRARTWREFRHAMKLGAPRYAMSAYALIETSEEIGILMAFLRGGTLADRLNRNPPLSVRAACGLCIQVLHGLTEVHEAGLVHADVKPDNVFLERSLTGRFCAWPDSWTSVWPGLPTRSGRNPWDRGGTPAWKSPEQWWGDDLTTQSDLFAAGLVLVAMFYSVLPIRLRRLL